MKALRGLLKLAEYYVADAPLAEAPMLEAQAGAGRRALYEVDVFLRAILATPNPLTLDEIRDEARRLLNEPVDKPPLIP